jgi:hypothetical protein
MPLSSDKVYQLLAHGRWFFPGTSSSSTTKTGRHDIAEILLKVALNTINQIKSNIQGFTGRSGWKYKNQLIHSSLSMMSFETKGRRSKVYLGTC